MIDHLGITVSNIGNSKLFYLNTLGALGYELIKSGPKSVSFGIRSGPRGSADPGGEFWLSEAAPMIPRIHIAFSAGSKTEVDAFFVAGKSAGGVDNGAPGLRPHFHSHYYAVFILDPDGYNIEALFHKST